MDDFYFVDILSLKLLYIFAKLRLKTNFKRYLITISDSHQRIEIQNFMISYSSMLTIRYARNLIWPVVWLTIVWPIIALPASRISLDEEAWIQQADVLVLSAQSSHTDATLFNKDVRSSRSKLRKILQQARKNRLSDELRRLHSTMLLLDVLLKSAAACQTAGYIVCPPMLMIQLKTVLKNSQENLQIFNQSLEQSSTGKSP